MVGIYFLKEKENIVYVGQSINIHRRVEQHKDKEFSNYSYIECSKELLDCTEEFYILKYNPKYNKRRYEIKVAKNCERKVVKKDINSYARAFTLLKVKEETHRKIKMLAVDKGMTIPEVVNYLVDKEKNESNNKTFDYRKRG